MTLLPSSVQAKSSCGGVGYQFIKSNQHPTTIAQKTKKFTLLVGFGTAHIFVLHSETE